ncbi:unnamed protein product, partial [Polarella glacialis]
ARSCAHLWEMAGRGGGGYVNGRYVANAGGGKGPFGGGGGGRGRDSTGRSVGWAGGGEGGEGKTWERKPGDEDVDLERKFDIDILQSGEGRVGYLFNMKPTRHYDEGGRTLTGMLLYFLQRDGRTFRCTFLYRPYFFVQAKRESLDSLRDILAQRFQNEGVHAEIVDKEDLAMEDHIIGRKRKMIKLSFPSTEGSNKAQSLDHGNSPKMPGTNCQKAIQLWSEKNEGANPEEAAVVKLLCLSPPIEKMDSSLNQLVNVRHLALSTNCIDKMISLPALKNIEILSLGRNMIKKISGLEEIGATLRELWISYNSISDLGGLSACTKLTTLFISNNKIK